MTIDSKFRAPPGLKGLVVAETTIGDVLADEGRFHIRGIDGISLAREVSFEEVWHLVLRGTLPAPEALLTFRQQISSARSRAEPAIDAVHGLGSALSCSAAIHQLRTAYSVFCGTQGWRSALDSSTAEGHDQAVATGAALPVLLTALWRLSNGLEVVRPRDGMGQAASLLYMLEGDEADAARARALEQYLICTIEHGFNASAFACRVIASTRADLGSAVSGALSALSGPLHGGAPGLVLEMLDAIDASSSMEKWIIEEVQCGRRIMGFGHPVYRTEDPRSRLLREIALSLGGERAAMAVKVEEAANQILREMKPGTPIQTNVEFYSAVVLEAVGIPRDLFTSVFACSRAIGWTAHYLEQLEDPRILRPSAHYVGSPPVLSG